MHVPRMISFRANQRRRGLGNQYSAYPSDTCIVTKRNTADVLMSY